MEVVVRPRGFVSSAYLVVIAWALLLPTAIPRMRVRGTLHKFRWSPDVNLTDWSSKQHFYVDDWLLFYYQEMKQLYNVVEVNQTDYEWCRSENPIKDITGKAGRDVFHLQEVKPYYFISGGGYCFHGLKLAVFVENNVTSPPPASATPTKSNGSPSVSAFHNILPRATPLLAILLFEFIWF